VTSNDELMKGMVREYQPAPVRFKSDSVEYWKNKYLVCQKTKTHVVEYTDLTERLEKAELAAAHANETATEGWRQKKQWETRALIAERDLKNLHGKTVSQDMSKTFGDFFNKNVGMKT